jgi:hypothetical protein
MPHIYWGYKNEINYKTHKNCKAQHVVVGRGDDGLFFDVGQKHEQYLGRLWQES